MTDIICPLCGKPNPPELDECKYCQAPLKATGFLAPDKDEDELSQLLSSSAEIGKAEEQAAPPESASNLEQNIPDWLKKTEANFLDKPEAKPEEPVPDQFSEQIDSLLSQPSTPVGAKESAIDDAWLANLLTEAGLGGSAPTSSLGELPEEQADAFIENHPGAQAEGTAKGEQPSSADQVVKPDWLTHLEATSSIKLEGGISAGESEQKEVAAEETGEKKDLDQPEVPDWVAKPGSEEPPPSSVESEPPIAPAELPGWLEALRPDETVTPTEPVEDVSGADVAKAGPLVGLRGVISAHPSAIRARKPPTYSIKLRVTDEQRARVEMMEELLADEQKSKPLPTQPILTSQNILRLVIAVLLFVPIVWTIITKSQQTTTPQPGNIPGVIDFTQQVQKLPSGAPVLLAFDYEAGFSGEMNLAISNLITQLMIKSVYLTLVATTPSGPALAESVINRSSTNLLGSTGVYSNYANLGYIPGGTLGLLGLATSPRSILPYSLESSNVWETAPLNTISSIKDFNAVIVITSDPDTARVWIEQVGPLLQTKGTPLLIVTSSQAEPLIRPYYEANPPQVQGLVAGLAGGVAYSRTVGNIQQNGVWDAFSVGVTVSVLIILLGSIYAVTVKMFATSNKKED